MFKVSANGRSSIPLLSIELPELSSGATPIHRMQHTHSNTHQHMKHQLQPGLHVAIVTNPLGGHGGSLFAWETYVACRLSGIPAILATFDEKRRYPEIGTDIRRLPVPDGETAGKSGIENLGCLLPFAAEARSMGKFLIIDTRTAFSIQDPMFEVLDYCGICEADSSTALLPIRDGIPGYSAAIILCRDFLEIGFSFNQRLFRSWARGADLRPLPAMLDFPAIPLWRPDELSKKTLERIHGGHSCLDSDAGPPDPDLFGHIGGQTSRVSKNNPRQEIERHLHAARASIFDAILAPISNSSH